MEKEKMNPCETATYINKAVKRKYGLDLHMGGPNDFNRRLGSSGLASFLAKGGNSSEVNEVVNYLLGLHIPEVELLIWNSMSLMESGAKLEGAFLALWRKQVRQSWVFGREAYAGYRCNRTKPYKTQRLLIEPLSYKDIDAIRGGLVEDEATLQEVVNDSLSMAFKGFMIFFGILSLDKNEVIGFIALSRNYSMTRFGFDPYGDVGYFILKKFRGNGYAAETLSSLSSKVFANKVVGGDLSEEKQYYYVDIPFYYPILKAYVDVGNMASYKTCIKAGFKEEGKMSVMEKGKIECEYMMSLCKKVS
jgi:RimJ/RimL family protein N-acetyltransferase